MTLKTETRHAIDPQTAKGLDTDGLRAHFHKDGLFAEGEINLVYTHYDRLILGSAVPAGTALTLDHMAETGTPGFLDRREMGILNIGETGEVEVGGGEGGQGPRFRKEIPVLIEVLQVSALEVAGIAEP